MFGDGEFGDGEESASGRADLVVRPVLSILVDVVVDREALAERVAVGAGAGEEDLLRPIHLSILSAKIDLF